MADNSLRTPGAGETIASDDIGGVKFQRVKLTTGADGTAGDILQPSDAMATTGPLATGAMVYNQGSSTWFLARSAGADAQAAFSSPGNAPLLYNETTLDRQRGNTQGTLLASAARTATTSSAIVTNWNARGVLIYLNVTVASGTGGLQPVIQGVGPLGGTALNSTPAAVIATGQTLYMVYPGAILPAAGTGIVQVAAVGLPRNWLVTVVAGNATSYTYQIDYALIV